jgi:ABC-type Fe3+-hydroxamate transport system substrate-binding protein
LQPDVIISTSDAHVQSVLDREPWRSLRAVREHRVYILSDDSIVVRPGPRYNQGLQWIIDRLRPIGS